MWKNLFIDHFLRVSQKNKLSDLNFIFVDCVEVLNFKEHRFFVEKEFFIIGRKTQLLTKKMDTKTRQLEKLKTTIESLRNNFELILESTHIGKTQLKYVGTNTMRSEFEQKAVPLTIRKQKFQDILFKSAKPYSVFYLNLVYVFIENLV
ncbi:hypothetical protein RFI_38237 [Reticulomyxa filosa]|uniref:Uncharacterized protein n=1 Tax=Reticulomyxa filosa TaxID=46433 RepID=X6LES8_RETFI|nr:hypothetical protein RFI_38237 [Reticulomyxa filosa]|eukprot:ETN99244.1 hypothetical protein RFI_38237 [Reticulomyxa filosa]